MGARNSTALASPTPAAAAAAPSSHTAALPTCYLVFGEPNIRYVGSGIGPRIFPIASNDGDKSDAAQHRTRQLNLACAVPNTQSFDLLPVVLTAAEQRQQQQQRQHWQQQQEQEQQILVSSNNGNDDSNDVAGGRGRRLTEGDGEMARLTAPPSPATRTTAATQTAAPAAPSCNDTAKTTTAVTVVAAASAGEIARRAGYVLRCRVLLTRPARRVAVYTSVRVEYVVGSGVVLRAADTSPTSRRVLPMCVYERLHTRETTVCTTRPLMLHELYPAVYEKDTSDTHADDGTAAVVSGNNGNNSNNSHNAAQHRHASHTAAANGRNAAAAAAAATMTAEQRRAQQRPRVCSAPLVIVVEYDDDDNDSSSGSNKNNHTRSAAVAASSPAAAAAAATTPASRDDGAASAVQQRIVHYTMLDMPDAHSTSANRAQTAHTATTAVATEAEALHMRVARQLLQVGSEVYDLEDVFEVGVDDDLSSSVLRSDDDSDTSNHKKKKSSRSSKGGGGGGVEAMEQNVCVVCLCNANNTTLLPCRHMCVCHECAALLRLGTNRCPMCRTNIEQVMTL